ncbi:SDR family oxidoreductase [Tanticharoenia sakaeratensis]|uniref:Gluconate 5-dehydrogenase n=1 Tax=Tanticharoenia sakaeratensis NBRC 103193 TaxID=1231623 RepID=A0A0D6MHF4_9PROT|nr:SDR family oxidoreductase [Tanticharoenia sakaeratensis]GAN52703.1 gluconate 5-dehydrogenase [Tanticharoenia sakaeratensis NBRC 103193]GBQ24342.1 gluconate 5-dehydrogenase [Tanticharoenia sakaeratensis NBRC 103193]
MTTDHGFPLFSLAGRRALVTGSSKGIGYAIAEGLAAHGASIVLNARSAGPLEEARAQLASTGAEVAARACDVTDPHAVAAMIASIEDEIGPIDILINNAGIQHRAPLDEFPIEAWKRLTATNLDSVFYVAQAAAQRMIPRRSGKIVNICSVQSELARPNIAPYTATKGAVKMLTKGMATDWARHGLQCNGLAPGYFATELNDALVKDEAFSGWLAKRTPAGRWGEVSELIGAAVFLSSDASSFVNGHILYVDGGITASL